MATPASLQEPDSAADAAPRSLTPRQRERRERIQAATFTLLAQHGGEALSMKLIAQAAGVAERTLFNIYGSRDRLFALSVRERSEETIAEAHREATPGAHGPGLAFFHTLPGKLAAKTFEAPELARGLAPVLVEHADMVGLPEVYDHFAGGALRAMHAAGQVAIEDTTLVSRFVCMSMVGTVVLWAKGEIADAALEPSLSLAICQVLLPYAEPPLDVVLREEARGLTRMLSKAAAAP